MDSEKQPSLWPTNVPRNNGRLTGQKRPLKPKDVWAIRVRRQMEHRERDLALFNLAIDSKLRGCDLVRLQVGDVCAGGRVRDSATSIQKKTGRPVQFEITEQIRASIQGWFLKVAARKAQYLFPSRFRVALPMARTRCGERRQRWIRRGRDLASRKAATAFTSHSAHQWSLRCEYASFNTVPVNRKVGWKASLPFDIKLAINIAVSLGL